MFHTYNAWIDRGVHDGLHDGLAPFILVGEGEGKGEKMYVKLAETRTIFENGFQTEQERSTRSSIEMRLIRP